MKITFNLQEGFKEDRVIIFNKDEKIYEADDVSTRTQIGLAKSFEQEIDGKNPVIKVDIPTRSITGKKKIESDTDIHVGISINERKEIDWKVSNDPFMYM